MSTSDEGSFPTSRGLVQDQRQLVMATHANQSSGAPGSKTRAHAERLQVCDTTETRPADWLPGLISP